MLLGYAWASHDSGKSRKPKKVLDIHQTLFLPRGWGLGTNSSALDMVYRRPYKLTLIADTLPTLNEQQEELSLQLPRLGEPFWVHFFTGRIINSTPTLCPDSTKFVSDSLVRVTEIYHKGL